MIANDTGYDLSLPLTALLCHHIVTQCAKRVTQCAKEGFSKAVPMLPSLLSMNMDACCLVHHAES